MSAAAPRSAGAAGSPAEAEPPSSEQRLAESRERMRLWMLQSDGRQRARDRVRAARLAGAPPGWLDRLRSHAIIGTLADAVASWWASHPMRPAAHVAASVAREAVTPLAERHPLALVGGAFVVGTLLARIRPWRWISHRALFAGLATQIATRFVAQLPVDTLLDAVGLFGRRSGAAKTAHRHDGPAAQDPGPPTAAAMPTQPAEQRPTLH